MMRECSRLFKRLESGVRGGTRYGWLAFLVIAGVLATPQLPVFAGSPVAGNALSFQWIPDGDFVHIGDADVTDITGSFTIECWAKLAGASWLVVKHNHGNNGDGSWDLQVRGDGHFRFTVYTGGTDPLLQTPPSTIPFNEWVHIALVHNKGNGETTLYLNGLPIQTEVLNVPIENTAVPLRFGAQDGRANCELDEVRIWNIARAQEEILANHDRLVDSSTPGLVGYWRFDENIDEQAVLDLTSNANNGTLGPSSNVEVNDPERVVETAPIQLGNAIFVEVPTSLPDVDRAWLAWGDYDNDGDLDLSLLGVADSGPE